MFKIKFSVLTGLLLLAFAVFAAEPRAKYVFLFIGDGMGPTIRQCYQNEFPDSSLEKFPVIVPTGTNNSSNKTTDSAAAGTALACGIKTYNSAIGVGPDKKPVTSLAKILRDKKYSIGIITSVGLNDATPSAHYANRNTRKEYTGIIQDLCSSNFNFFAGGFLLGVKPDYLKKAITPKNYRFFNHLNFDANTPRDRVAFVAAMDPDWPAARQPRHLLSEVTAYAISCLEKNPTGFFMVVEGGAIDHRAHNNDFAGAMREMREFDLAVRQALEFKKKHPDDTLIIVTSDHDTGGLNIHKYTKSMLWKKQLKRAIDADSFVKNSVNNQHSDEQIISYLVKYFGMDKLTASEHKAMVEALRIYRDPELRKQKQYRSMYGSYNPVVVQMMRLRDARIGISWTGFGHTPRKVLTNAWGVGQELFKTLKENCEIPHLISRAMLGEDALNK